MLSEFANHLLSSGRAESTVHARLDHIKHLQRLHPLLDVTTADLEKILADRRRTHAAETRKSMRSSYTLFYRWAHKTGRMTNNPAGDLDPIPIPVTVPRLAPDDVVQLALITATIEQRTMIMLARFACLRLNELTTLHMRHREHDALRVTGKGEKERLVYINDDLMEILLDREGEVGKDSYYFSGRFGGVMHKMSVNKIITRVTGCNPHSLRHAGATAAYRATNDLRGVQDMLGHASMATTQRYLHLDVEAKRAVAAGTAFITPIRPRQTNPLSRAA